MREWFGGTPAANESREDVYLVADGNDGVGLKLRGQALELKLRSETIRGEGPNWAGLAECWQKWRWPYDQARAAHSF